MSKFIHHDCISARTATETLGRFDIIEYDDGIFVRHADHQYTSRFTTVDAAKRLAEELADQYDVDNAGYKFTSYDSFIAAKDLPEGILERARATGLLRRGCWVVYDPDDDVDGWLLVGDHAGKILRETVRRIDADTL